ncbi:MULTISPECIES: AAA family ATPase [Pseudovibrio]|uniref:AAA family ATPase n=1 Tax=Stappiaceae TaxID=2821832 RepID=UPI002366D367|nr:MULTISPECIES: CtpF protein [Pseudovibrio]MDD7910091.1 CtpF protein [Pseudovibrio exalbescens]MDX5592374.1 CtpF protein [Pseudovibrio sp. SPO723]
MNSNASDQLHMSEVGSTPAFEPNQSYETAAVPRVSIAAFCETEAAYETLIKASSDRRMSKAHTSVNQGSLSECVALYENAPTPNLLIIETTLDGQALLRELDTLADVCDPGTRVMVIGQINDVELYRALMARGISEYLLGPIGIHQLIATISGFYAEPGAEPLGKTIAVIGAKGGCGASTIAHNLSWVISKRLETDVALADCDLPFGTAGLDFNQDPLQGMWEAVSAPERLDQTFLDRLLSKCNERLSFLAAPASLDKPYDFSEEHFDQLVETMRSSTPTVVLDLPHTWNAWVRHLLETVDIVIVVAEPDLANLRNAKNLVDALVQLRPNDIRPYLVLNKVTIPKRPEIKPDEFSKALDVQNLASIPFDPGLFGTASNNGQMIGEFDQKHAVGGLFEDMARVVTGRGEVGRKKQSALSSIFSKLKKSKA